MDHASLWSTNRLRVRVGAEPGDTEAQVAADLVVRIHAGDKAAESAMVARYRPRLLHALTRLAKDFSSAEDAANEALLVAITKLRAAPIEQPARLGGYLFGVAKNVVRGENRKTSKEAQSDPELFDLVASASPNQEQLLEQMDVSSHVRQVMLQVANERYREVLVRYYLHQQEKAQICEAMQLSRRDFTQIISRARISFRKAVRTSDA